MNILNVEKVTKGYRNKDLFSEAVLGVNEGDKIGIIGMNGTGKSTLLKIIAGIEEPDGGQVVRGNEVALSYLPQNPEFCEGIGILEYVTEGKTARKEGWSIEGEAKTILNRLGIFDFEQEIEKMSGGEKKRLALARTLVSPAEVLILDEPTNHLDGAMSDWLEDYLIKFRGELILVTHDRYFLDRVTNRIVEIDNGKLYSYQSNYEGYLELKMQREERMAASERKRKTIFKKELAWIRRGARARSTKAKGRIDRFEELKKPLDLPAEQHLEMDSIASRMGKKTIELHGISKSYGKKRLFKDFEYIFLKGQHVGIVGNNGCGKTTLLRVLTGLETPDEGYVEIGETIKIGYFSQNCEEMDGSLRVIDYIRETAEFVKTTKGTASASQILERFLFSPEMQYARIENLSGGERRRLYLLNILMSSPNVLILDEPTNDLDIATLQVLEDYLDDFQGIVITVSHDRYFLDRTVSRIFAFEENGTLCQYEGGYTDYRNALMRDGKVLESLKEQNQKQKVEKKEKGSRPKREEKLRFSYKEKKEYETIDDEIAALEEKQSHLETKMQEVASDYGKLNEIMKEKEDVDKQLAEKMERWMYLTDLAEKIQAQP